MIAGSIVRGAVAGLAATGPMTLVIMSGKAVGLLHTPPPEQITKTAANKAQIDDNLSESGEDAAWLTAHFAYGAGCGAIYSLMRRWLPGSSVVSGLIFGGLVWFISYMGLLPGLRLYPKPEHDSNTRIAVMIAAHVVYGVTLAGLEQEIRDRTA